MLRSILFKACTLALAALAGCGGGGGTASALSGAGNAAGNGTSSTTDTGTGSGSSATGTGSTTNSVTGTTPGTGAGSASASSGTSGSSSGATTVAPTTAPSALSVSVIPANATTGLNGVLKLAVNATSSAAMTYQWRRNGLSLGGETASTLERILGASDQGARFDVVVSNSAGSTTSAATQAQLILAPATGQAGPACHTQLPPATTGTPVKALANLDAAVQAYLTARQTPAANLVVRYNGIVVLERGYGWQDFTCTRPMPYNGIFRLASLAKPLTSAAVRKAVSDGRLQYSDRIFCLQGSPANCILDLRTETAADPRMADITIQHLIDHQSGWDKDLIQDPSFRDIEIAAARGVSTPPSKLDIARFVVSTTPLDATPGAVTSYLNFGYTLLGLALEARTGQSFSSHLQSSVLNALSLSSSEALLARSLPALRDAREPWYSDPRVDAWVNIFDVPGPLVKFPDGGASYENLDAAGGLAFSARAYTRFMASYWLSGFPRVFGGPDQYFFGSLPGTFTFAYQRGPIDLVLLTNQRQLDLGGPPDEDILALVQSALSQVSTWPGTPPAGHQP